jgi:hypothetical protein
VDLRLTEEEAALQQAVRSIVERAQPDGGPIGVMARSAHLALEVSGFLSVMQQGGRVVDAVLVTEAIASTGACVPAAARAVVGGGLSVPIDASVIGLLAPRYGDLVRFGCDADVFLVLGQDGVGLVRAAEAVVTPVDTRWGYPMARVVSADGGERLKVDPDRLRVLWSIAIAAELGGLMAGAVSIAAAHVRDRVQFGRPIGSYQAVQHRLARAHVVAQGTSWLARQAAWRQDPEVAFAAACYAADGGKEVISSTQQVCGAIGITDEFGLVRFTAPIAMLITELGGGRAHARELGRARYESDRPRRRAPGRTPAAAAS